MIKVLQWPRYCLENFLLDIEIIADLLMDGDVVKIPLIRRDDAYRLVKSLWEAQVSDMALREAYLSYGFESPGLRSGEINGQDFDKAGGILFYRVELIQAQVGMLQRSSWLEDFVSRCDVKRRELVPQWERDWLSLCDGKRLLSDLHRQVPMRLGILNLKKRIMMKMSADHTTSWRELERMLTNFLAEPVRQ